MFSNACVQILKRVDKAELQAIYTYVRKKASSKTQEFKLFMYLMTCHPDLNDENLATEVLYKLLFKNKKMANSSKSLSNVGNKLSSLLHEYLLEHALSQNPQEKEFLLASAYSRLGLQSLLDKQIERYFPSPEKALKKNPEKNAAADTEENNGLNIWSHWHYHRLFHLRYYSRETLKTDRDEDSLTKSMQQLDLAYLAAKLRMAHEMEMVKRVSGREPSVQFSVEELREIKAIIPADNPLLQLYYQAYEVAINPSDEGFDQFKKWLKENNPKLSKDEQGNFLTALINYASFAIKRGKDRFYAEAADLHHLGLQNRTLLQDNKMTPEILLNVVNLHAEAGKVVEAEELLNQWKDHLPEGFKKEVIQVITARIHFYQQKFSFAIDAYSPNKRYVNHLMELTARATQIQSGYELDDYEQLTNNCAAFAKALDRKQDRFSEQHQASFGNFIKMVTHLEKIRIDPDLLKQTSNKDLLDKLEEFELLVCKSWFRNKIKELKP
ncbi:hypothetical protein [Haliscomenobacter sp.]|uniref:hypothetical protein n=1 Tax=Haliscomenobacter sp. TaxID=2717303 RepID=UPI00359351FF